MTTAGPMEGMTPEQKQAFVLNLIKEGKVMRFAQNMVNKLAPKFAQHFPDIAEDEPKQIGEMAKAMVMAELMMTASGSAQKALDALIDSGALTVEEAYGTEWKGLMFSLLASKAGW